MRSSSAAWSPLARASRSRRPSPAPRATRSGASRYDASRFGSTASRARKRVSDVPTVPAPPFDAAGRAVWAFLRPVAGRVNPGRAGRPAECLGKRGRAVGGDAMALRLVPPPGGRGGGARGLLVAGRRLDPREGEQRVALELGDVGGTRARDGVAGEGERIVGGARRGEDAGAGQPPEHLAEDV